MTSRSDAAQHAHDSGVVERSSNGESWKRVAMYVALCVGVFAIRTPFMSVPMITDEGGYAYWASIWTRDHELYRDFAFSRPQAILVVYKLILATLGGSVESVRAVAALFTCCTACAIAAFGRRFFSERAAWVSAWMFALFSTSPRIEGFTGNAEIFTLAPLVLNAWLVWGRRWFWAGVATAVAFQLKPSGFEGCVLVALWVLLSSDSIKAAFSATWRSSLGFLVGLAPCLIHGVWVGWGDFWYGMVTLRGKYYTPDVVGLGAQIDRIHGALTYTHSSWWIPAVLFALALTQLPSQPRRFLMCWLAAAIVGMQIGFWWDWHFFMQVMPPLCFAAGAGLLALSKARFRAAWALALALGLAVFTLRDGRLWLESPRAISWEIYHRDGYLYAEQIASYVAQSTAPSDTLYIAFGQAEIYHLSQRKPAVPTQMYYWHAAYFDEGWAETVRAIGGKKPAFVIWVQPPPPNRMTSQAFGQLVMSGYQPDRKYGSIMLFKRRPG